MFVSKRVLFALLYSTLCLWSLSTLYETTVNSCLYFSPFHPARLACWRRYHHFSYAQNNYVQFFKNMFNISGLIYNKHTIKFFEMASYTRLTKCVEE